MAATTPLAIVTAPSLYGCTGLLSLSCYTLNLLGFLQGHAFSTGVDSERVMRSAGSHKCMRVHVCGERGVGCQKWTLCCCLVDMQTGWWSLIWTMVVKQVVLCAVLPGQLFFLPVRALLARKIVGPSSMAAALTCPFSCIRHFVDTLHACC